MKEEKEEFNGYDIYRDYEKSRRKYAIKQMFKKGNLNDEIRSDYNRVIAYLYWIKALICLIINRRNHLDFGIFIITYDEYSCIDSLSWEYVSVGEGLFKGWRVNIGTDGT